MKWTKNIRPGKTEWVCQHGVGHPDMRTTTDGVHGCDGCCSRKDFPPNKHTLKIVSLRDAQARCTCGKWHYSCTTPDGISDAEIKLAIERQFEFHATFRERNSDEQDKRKSTGQRQSGVAECQG